MRIAITGASGLIGTGLSSELRRSNYEFIPMIRSRNQSGIYWNYRDSEIDLARLESTDAIIHLAGESLASGPWTSQHKEAIYESRVFGTRFLVDQLKKLSQPPKHFLCASAVGIYPDTQDRVTDESSVTGSHFLAKLCKDWEAEAQKFPGRNVQMRFGMVLARRGGALGRMLPVFQLGLGGPVGKGNQYVSWIDIKDAALGIQFLLENSQISGPVNLVSPNPVPQKEFAKALGRVLQKPSMVPTPAFALKLALGEMAEELLLKSIRIVPTVMAKNGFQFQYPTLLESLKSHFA